MFGVHIGTDCLGLVLPPYTRSQASAPHGDKAADEGGTGGKKHEMKSLRPFEVIFLKTEISTFMSTNMCTSPCIEFGA